MTVKLLILFCMLGGFSAQAACTYDSERHKWHDSRYYYASEEDCKKAIVYGLSREDQAALEKFNDLNKEGRCKLSKKSKKSKKIEP